MPLPRIRTVPTASGATAVQVLWRYIGRKPVLDHIGSAHNDIELEELKNQARKLIGGGQLSLNFEDATNPPAVGSLDDPLPVSRQQSQYLITAIDNAYARIGLDTATGGDEIFRNLVRARIIHPGSKLDSITTLQEVGIASSSYRTITRALPTYATEQFRSTLSRQLCTHRHIGRGVLVLYDVTTLYFETDTPDELRKPGFSKERRLEPQITVGMLSDGAGFPLAVQAFEGNRGETTTMIPMIKHLQDAYELDQVTVVADAGMFSQKNKNQIVDAGLDYIIGVRFKNIPVAIQEWLDGHPGQDYTHGQIWSSTDRTGCGPDDQPRSVTFYQYSWDRARRSLRGIDEQLKKAEAAVAGHRGIKRNRYVDLKAPDKKVNYALAEKNRKLAGVKGYETSRVDLSAEQVIAAYRQLLKIEKSFRMSKSDLKARPIYHRKEESIHAHLAVVMAALAVGHDLESASGLSLKRLVRMLKGYRAFEVEIGGRSAWAAVPIDPVDRPVFDRLGLLGEKAD